jgi:hypothetical protein
MNHNELIYLVFLSQILIISVIIPSWVKKRVNGMISKFPPESYPKLYPVSLDSIKYTLKTFNLLNLMVIIMGVVIIVISVVTASDELLNWDTQSMLTLFFMLQLSVFAYLGFSGFKYQQLMRQVSQSSHRKASLKPRKMIDFVPKQWLFTNLITFIVYALLVVYIQQNPFAGFVGYWNILFVLLLNCFYLLMTHRIISGKKSDPHQSHEDWINHTRLITKLLIIGAILCNLFLSINLLLAVLDLRHIGDIIQSLYFQLVALIMIQTTTYEPEHYDVYRAETGTA